MQKKRKSKQERLAILRMLISSKEIHSQQDLLDLLAKERIRVTQATLSRDLKQLKVAKAASMNGDYVYVLPNETMYKRVTDPVKANQMLRQSGILGINFTGLLGVIKTRPGYASAIAYDIDRSNRPQIIGTIAGDDTIFIALREDTDINLLTHQLLEEHEDGMALKEDKGSDDGTGDE
ncbi:MAG: arginine repressor [Prevotella sp.]|nr:arginine repressor [Bacteroidales bacterium]MDY4954999.1 arginine repressor [Prevotella sp.]